MKTTICAALIAALSSTSLFAQQIVPASVPPAPMAQSAVATSLAPMETELPANTEILLSMNSEITSTTHRAGDTFSMTVATDVRIGDQVVIPRGTRAMGEVTWRTGRGAFGKSGKMNIALRYIELDGQRIPVEGTYRQEGEGNTLATVGGIILVGVFAGFITGSRARIPSGRELTARTSIALPLVAENGRVRLASSFGAQLDTWRVTQASSVEGTCRSQSEPRARGNAERLAELTHECVTRASAGQTASR